MCIRDRYCAAKFGEESAYFYSHKNSNHLCLSCADKIDDTKTGSAKLLDASNLILINMRTDKRPAYIVKDDIGRSPVITEETEKNWIHEAGCCGCGKGPIAGPRYVCLNCGVVPGVGFLDFCDECVKVLANKGAEAHNEMVAGLKKMNHDSYNHLLLRIYFNYGDYMTFQ
eukprot:TRINITY_DN2776_c0_g1_i1.p1 TRINITY_DN2776_c0_g1~~TRINITY_DN2776_c0_g1_i1.p1  ORF type:complete len:190 (+),score=47.52 TRINITY_DN2776_c0_g1_i1:61-570(+)